MKKKEKVPKEKPVNGEELARVVRRKAMCYRLRVIVIIVLGFLVVFGGVVLSTWLRANEYQEQQDAYATEAAASLARYYEDYEKEIPKAEFEVGGLEEIEVNAEKIRASKYNDQKREIRERVARLKEFAEMRGRIAAFFNEGILKSETEKAEVEAVQAEFAEMRKSYQQVLRVKLEMIQNQYQAMVGLEAAVMGLFEDGEMKNVRGDLTREQYDEVKAKADTLPQRDVAETYAERLKRVEEVLAERERIAEEARRKAAEEYRRRQAEIAAAWRVLNVPYWSQNGEGVKNGCEAAALLMGLQYKGYLGGMNLRTYAEMMPKSDDPFTGFRGNIFESSKGDAPFWIAPAPLAAFGRESSGANVVDITGSSLDALDAEVAAGNPVVIYLTLGYVAPSAWRYGAPANLHVMLLTGYNGITGVQRVTDPLTLNGKTHYDLPKAQVESILNATGNRAVVVR